MKNILVPFDFSKTAEYALKLALSIAEKQKAKVNLLYVVIDPFTIRSSGLESKEYINLNIRNFLEAIKKESFTKLKQVVEKINNKDVKIAPYIFVDSNVYKGILRFIETKKTGLVVMGTHGVSDLKSKYLGTNTERVFRMTKKPVLIVREEIKQPEFRRIVFATDLEQDSRKVMNQAWELLKQYDAKIDILRINTKKDAIRSTYAIGRMRNLSKKYKSKFDFIITDAETPEAGINEYCKKSRADLLVIGVHRKKGFKRLFTDRISESITRISRIPVLTLDI
ncbi:MAG TPA: universal stress protein [Ignavibacteria bacterium]|nr:universal stress protein [Ignavibacteria bacterium]